MGAARRRANLRFHCVRTYIIYTGIYVGRVRRAHMRMRAVTKFAKVSGELAVRASRLGKYVLYVRIRRSNIQLCGSAALTLVWLSHTCLGVGIALAMPAIPFPPPLFLGI